MSNAEEPRPAPAGSGAADAAVTQPAPGSRFGRSRWLSGWMAVVLIIGVAIGWGVEWWVGPNRSKTVTAATSVVTPAQLTAAPGRFYGHTVVLAGMVTRKYGGSTSGGNGGNGAAGNLNGTGITGGGITGHHGSTNGTSNGNNISAPAFAMGNGGVVVLGSNGTDGNWFNSKGGSGVNVARDDYAVVTGVVHRLNYSNINGRYNTHFTSGLGQGPVVYATHITVVPAGPPSAPNR